MKLTQVCRCGEEITFELATDEILSSLAKWFVMERLKVQGWDVVKDDIFCSKCFVYLKEDEKFDQKYEKEIEETDEYNYTRHKEDIGILRRIK